MDASNSHVRRPHHANQDSTLAPIYKPRYLVEETISLNAQDVPRTSFCGKCCRFFLGCLSYAFSSCFSAQCMYAQCCGSQRKITAVIALTGVACLLFNIYIIEPLAFSVFNTQNFALAKVQSYGYFDDIPQSRWKLLQKRVNEQRNRQRKVKKGADPSSYANPAQFYKHNWHADFTCPHEERVGAMRAGGKWLCDPRSIRVASAERLEHNGSGCLIYTSSGDINSFKFEKSLKDIVGDCEIHVFSPQKQSRGITFSKSINYHPWGFKGEGASGGKKHDKFALKTIPNTIKELGHVGKTIDLFVLDCEGCEFDVVKDVFRRTVDDAPPAVFMQFMIQVHGAPPQITNEFFSTIQNEGYVTYHKEPSQGGDGNEQTYGFLKLSPEFFKAH